MNEDYNPTRKEVFEELRKEFGKRFVVGVTKAGKNTLEACFGFGVGFCELNAIPYKIPSDVREYKRAKESTVNDFNLSISKIVGVTAGVVAGFVGVLGQVFLYSSLAGGDWPFEKAGRHPEALLIPVATNVASGVYEIGRKIYNNTKQKLIEEHKSGIEKRVSD